MKKDSQAQDTELVLATTGNRALTTPTPLFDIQSIFQLAIEKQGTAETLEKLMGIRRELNAEAAKNAFDESLAAFQAECPVIEKRKNVMNKDGRSVRYKYAPLDSIVGQTKELLRKHGFSYTITTETKDKNIKSICKITHRAGHSEYSAFEVPIDPDAFMNQQQKFAAALTYSKRYAFCNAFGILTGDEDLDANTTAKKASTSGKVATDATRKWMMDELQKVDQLTAFEAYANEKGWLAPDEKLEQIDLNHVPTTRSDLNTLIADVKKWTEESA